MSSLVGVGISMFLSFYTFVSRETHSKSRCRQSIFIQRIMDGEDRLKGPSIVRYGIISDVRFIEVITPGLLLWIHIGIHSLFFPIINYETIVQDTQIFQKK